MTKQQIRDLQTQLNAKGANLKVDGILGPATTAAMNSFSSSLPNKAASTLNDPEQVKELQRQLNSQGANLKVDGILGPKTTEAMNKAISTSVASNPALSHLTAQNDPNTIVQAYTSGDWSSVVDNTGQPFSVEIQQEAVKKANKALAPGFDEAQRYNEADTGNKIKQNYDTYKSFLDTEASNFAADKQNLDQDAANKGVLFSGGRIQKEQNLKNLYEKQDAAKAASVASKIGELANDYQYKYGNDAVAKPTLSSYYNLGSNVYNPNVSRNGVSSGSVSSIYNPSANNYQGTEVNKNKAAVQTRAASLLTNKTNKIVPYGYKTQL